MKHKLLLILLSIALILPAASFAKKPPKRQHIIFVDAAGTFIGVTQFQQTPQSTGVLLDADGELVETNIQNGANSI